ncbi:MAG TPA: hypothetical protein VME69_15490 [Methylocella sp.]|nr:hypothetical protein [Methylocella sp.]
MKKAFVICAAAFIAIWALVSSSTKANAEDAGSRGVPLITRLPWLAPVPPSAAAQPEKAYYHHHSYRHHYYYYHHRSD